VTITDGEEHGMNSLASGWPITEIFDRCQKRPADEVAWEEFVRRFHLTVRAGVIRAYKHKMGGEPINNLHLSEKTIDELIQAVYCRLIEHRSKVLKEFDLNYPGSIYRYLTIISYRVVFTHFRGLNQFTRH
jgi:hypothetical protein